MSVASAADGRLAQQVETGERATELLHDRQ
jgi:hypothetical protein